MEAKYFANPVKSKFKASIKSIKVKNSRPWSPFDIFWTVPKSIAEAADNFLRLERCLYTC